MHRAAMAALAPLEVAGRLDRLRALLAAAGDDGDGRSTRLLVTTPANIRWLTGFSGSAGLLLVTPERALLTTDGRYRTQSAEQLAAAGVGDDGRGRHRRGRRPSGRRWPGGRRPWPRWVSRPTT